MTTISIYDYEVRNDSISITRLDQHFAEADTNDFFMWAAKNHASQGWMVCGNKIIIPNPSHPTCEIYTAEQFHERFRGDFFDDLLLEYATDADLKWEEPWMPEQFDEAEDDAWRDFRRQCGV